MVDTMAIWIELANLNNKIQVPPIVLGKVWLEGDSAQQNLYYSQLKIIYERKTMTPITPSGNLTVQPGEMVFFNPETTELIAYNLNDLSSTSETLIPILYYVSYDIANGVQYISFASWVKPQYNYGIQLIAHWAMPAEQEIIEITSLPPYTTDQSTNPDYYYIVWEIDVGNLPLGDYLLMSSRNIYLIVPPDVQVSTRILIKDDTGQITWWPDTDGMRNPNTVYFNRAFSLQRTDIVTLGPNYKICAAIKSNTGISDATGPLKISARSWSIYLFKVI